MHRWIPWVVWFVVAIFCLPRVVHADERDQERVLEGRLIAPCCWLQTLDVHESPLASELRGEVHARLQGGASVREVEADLVERYGERIRAIPAGSDPRRGLGLSTVVVVLGAGGLLLLRFVRRVRRARLELPPPARVGLERYDQRLDDELAERSW